MAMTAAVKDELSRVDVAKPCCRRSEMAALLRFAGGLHIVSGRVVVEAELDTGAAARRLRQDIAEIYGHDSEVLVMQGILKHAHMRPPLTPVGPEDRQRLKKALEEAGQL